MIFPRISRRHFLARTAQASAALLASRRAFSEETVQLPFANGERQLVQFPGKRPLILLTHRPPQLETPFAIFNEGVITPNDAFFVRYHLSGIPLSIDPESFRLEIKGQVQTPLKLSLAELRRDFENVEIVAVNQCSGNSRGLLPATRRRRAARERRDGECPLARCAVKGRAGQSRGAGRARSRSSPTGSTPHRSRRRRTSSRRSTSITRAMAR